MKFGVIVCPTCKQVKGVDLSCKTTKCLRCGKVLTIDKLKIFYKTNSQKEIQQAIGLLNAEFDGKLEEFKDALQNNR